MPSPGIKTTCMSMVSCEWFVVRGQRSEYGGGARLSSVPCQLKESSYYSSSTIHMHDNILQSVGRTPLVRLRHVAEGLPVPVYVKFEAANPGGSIKDRVAVAMIADAERKGWLRRAGRSSRPPPAIPASAWRWSRP